MFRCCEALKDIKALENWNVSNKANIRSMFVDCKSLSNYKPLDKWKLEKEKIKEMFSVFIKLHILKS